MKPSYPEKEKVLKNVWKKVFVKKQKPRHKYMKVNDTWVRLSINSLTTPREIRL